MDHCGAQKYKSKAGAEAEHGKERICLISLSLFFFFERGLKMVARASMKFLFLKEESDKDKIMVAQ